MAATVTEQTLPYGRLISAYGTPADVQTTLAGATGHGLSNIKYVWNPFNCQVIWETFVSSTVVGVCYWTPVT